MTICDYERGFFRCDKRGWLAGRCLTHRLDTIRANWTFGTVSIEIDLGRLNVPHYTVDPEHDRPEWRSFDFGTDGCDPVIGIHWQRRGT